MSNKKQDVIKVQICSFYKDPTFSFNELLSLSDTDLQSLSSFGDKCGQDVIV